MNNLLDSGLGSTIAFGGEVVLVGMLTVFSVLGIIWLCLTIFRVVFYDLPNKRSTDSVAEVKAAPVVAAVEQVETDDDEIIAVIAAAIAAAESESNGLKFRVVSFRRM